jgi:hypothetical protein
MQFFTIKIQSKVTWEFLPQIPIFFENVHTMIGVCHIKVENGAMIGECRLEADLTLNYFVLFQLHTLQKTREFLTGIIIKGDADHAKTIEELITT